MDNLKITEMSNSELKLYMETLINDFNSKKNKIVNLCKDMENIEKKYLSVKHELNMRKNFFN